jgi:hypothetical protein
VQQPDEKEMYVTTFEGHIIIWPVLPDYFCKYFESFCARRHCRVDVGPSHGVDGEFYPEDVPKGDHRIVDYNRPPERQPGLWCDWHLEHAGDVMILRPISGANYRYVEWLLYLKETFFDPFGSILEGEVRWQGEDGDDTGSIICREGEVVLDHPIPNRHLESYLLADRAARFCLDETAVEDREKQERSDEGANNPSVPSQNHYTLFSCLPEEVVCCV